MNDATPVAKPWTLTKHQTFRRVIRIRNPDGTLQELAGSTFKLFVKPGNGEAEFEINATGPADQKLIVDTDENTITIYIADEAVDEFTWRTADLRFEQEDSQGDKRQRFKGSFRFET